MASLKSIFIQGVDTAFSIFSEAVKTSTYKVTNDDGFDDSVETEILDMPTILDKFSQEDVRNLSFYKLIQPTDTKAMIPGKYFTTDCKAGNILDVDGREFSIVGFETDPYDVLYTLLLRDL